MKFNNSKINFIIDILMFLVMIPVAAIGILMKLVLIPGSDRWLKYGDNVEIYILGMERHQWGTIHLILSLVFIGLFILHILFHWKQILNWFCKFINNRIVRYLFLLFLLVFIVLVWIYPFVVKPELEYGVHGVGDGMRRQLLQKGISQDELDNIPYNPTNTDSISGDYREKENRPMQQNRKITSNKRTLQTNDEIADTINVTGDMSLGYAANKYGISAKYIMEKLKIPEYESPAQRLGALRRTYNFHMDDVNEIIFNYFRDGNVVISDTNNIDMVTYSDHNALLNSIDIRGYFTVRDIAKKYKIPEAYIMDKLDIPKSESANQKLGTLRRIYNFNMNDIRDIIINYKNRE